LSVTKFLGYKFHFLSNSFQSFAFVSIIEFHGSLNIVPRYPRNREKKKEKKEKYMSVEFETDNSPSFNLEEQHKNHET